MPVTVCVVVRSAAVPAGVDLSGERASDCEASRAPCGRDGPPLQLPRRLHPGGQEHQPLHQAGQVGRAQTYLLV